METQDKIQPDMNFLVTEYGNSILRMCFLYLKDESLAEDAVQETFLKVYKNYGTYQGNSSEKTWIMRIAINVCKDFCRSGWNQKVDMDAELEMIYGSYESPFRDDTVIREIMKLPEKYKAVIILFYYQELQTIEIANVLNISPSSVSVRLKRAKEKLKKALGGWYYDAD